MGCFSYIQTSSSCLFSSNFYFNFLIFILFYFLTFCRELLLQIPCWLYLSVGSFSYTSLAAFSLMRGETPHSVFMWGVSLKHPVLASVLCKAFLLHIACWLCFCIWGVSLTHPLLVSFYAGTFSRTSRASFVSGTFLLHIPSWL